MDREHYTEKMNELLKDDVYQKKPKGYASSESQKFNKSARKILKRSEMGKRLLHTLEESPATPKMRGLPKVHKTGTPMRPITSGIGSAPHRLAKTLAKPLTKALGSISAAHLRNSGDLLERLKEMTFHDKKLASFDVKALFTNVPIEGAITAIEKALAGIPNDALPLPRKDYLALVKLCLKFDPFTFNDEEYAQRDGLAMGSPLSPVAACIFMETLEEEEFSKIMGEDTTWFRYVDDVLIIAPQNMNLDEKLEKLNEVHENIKFTLEEEEDQMLNFLDITIIRTDEGVKFKVFRKPTNKEDYIHFYSSHSIRTKSGIAIGFFLRALRICSEEFLEEEIRHIFQVFTDLRYPKALLVKWKNKAKRIRSTKKQATREETKKDVDSRRERQTIVVPHSKHVQDIAEGLRHAGIRVIEKSGVKIGDIVKKKKSAPENENSIIYRIPCGGCKKSYVGETHRGLKIRISEHRRDLRHHRLTNSMAIHAEEEDHLPNWEAAEAIKNGLSKSQRKIIESALIESVNCTNHRGGFYTLSTPFCNLACKSLLEKFDT